MRAGFVAMYNDKRDCDAFIEALKEFTINAAAAV
jgi:selenocysteine lyase/cysteine desulfurase